MQCIMENIKTCELCLEQLIKTEDFENLNYDEKQYLTILKNLEISVRRDAKICSNCVNVSHMMYNFKTSCLANNDHLKTLIHPGINDKLILEEVIVKKTKSEFKNEEKICTFCLNFSEVNFLVEVNLEQDLVLKDKLGRCLPEIDTNIVQNPLICHICNELLKKLYNFISQREDTEALGNLDPKTDILVNENTSTVTIENYDENINESFVKEENCDGIEEPELQIKSENFDINEDIKGSINESNCLLKEGEIKPVPSSFPSSFTYHQTHRKTRKSTISKLYKCTECFFQSKYQNSLVRHKKNIENSKCNMCSFTASTTCEIVKHKKKDHKGKKQGLGNSQKPKPHDTIEEKKFVCDICSYQTNRNENLKQHYLIHKKPSEVNLFKCDYCPFATKWKSNLTQHTMRHKNPSELAKFKCNDCPYKTDRRSQLVRHVLVHKDPSEVNMFQCKVCPFQTKYEQSILLHGKKIHQVEIYTCEKCTYKSKFKNCYMRHLRYHKECKQPAKSSQMHKNPSVLAKFKCNDCPYKTNNRRYLVKHVLVHKNPSEVNMFQCKVCHFQTKYKKSILLHEKKHQVEIYTCDKCTYKSKFKNCYMRHLRYHKESKQLAKSSQNLKEVRQYKCNKCSYVGTRKWLLIKHQMVHKDLSERKKYTCIECLFQSLSKLTLQRHYKKNHSDLEMPFGELKTFRCNECDYETMYRRYILTHLQAHEKITASVKEELQEQDNTQDKEGTYKLGFSKIMRNGLF